MRSTLFLLAVASILSVAASGCARQPLPLAELGLEHPVWTHDGLYLVEQKGPGVLFIDPARQNLTGYESVMIDEIWLGFKEGGHEFNALENKRAVALVRRNIVRRLVEFGLLRSQEPGPGILRLRIAINQIDYQPYVVAGSSTVSLAPSGNASITLEFRDSVDDRRMLVYSQNRQLPFGVYSGPRRVGAERIADAFYEYSLDLVRYLEKAQQGELPEPRQFATSRSAPRMSPATEKELEQRSRKIPAPRTESGAPAAH